MCNNKCKFLESFYKSYKKRLLNTTDSVFDCVKEVKELTEKLCNNCVKKDKR